MRCSARSALIGWRAAACSCFRGLAATTLPFSACRCSSCWGFCANGERSRHDDRAMKITGKTRLAGIMGWPIAHSRSPALHNFWIDEHDIDGVYVPMAVRPEHLAEALRALPALGFRGCNLTLPHKQAALSIVDRVDPLAARIGAINTVVVAADG